MPRIHAAASAVIDATPETVYAILADYRNGHPQILPERYFLGLEVERGGTGAGTLVQFRMRAFGRTRTYRAEITEPQPGRVLAETNLDEQGAVTTFTVAPLERGRRAQVTITTEWSSSGVKALVQRLLAPPLLRRIYAEELQNLARLAAAQQRQGATGHRSVSE